MPEMSLKDSIITSLSAQEPWPDNVKLFQPYEVEQILLPDNASCLAVQAFLKMCNLPFEVEMRWNAEFMSPSGRVPFIKCGAFVVSELEPIVQFAANKGVSLCSRLSSEEKAEMRAYMSLITNVLVNAELYISWVDNETFTAVTRVRNSSVYPWPLGWLQTRAKRTAVGKRLKALHWHDKTLEQVLADVEQCCNSLSQRLGDRDYFFGSPTPLDALVYGHTRALLGATGPRAPLVLKHLTGAILRHALRISNLTQMNLTPQEQYLVSQAFCVSRRSPERERSPRSRRRLCVRTVPAEQKAFDSKAKLSQKTPNVIANESEVPYEYNHKTSEIETMDYVKDLLQEIVEKREEIADPKESSENIDFEVIVLPQASDVKRYLDRIDEHEVNTTVSIANDIGDVEDLDMANNDVFDHGPSNYDVVGDKEQSDSVNGAEDCASGTSCDASAGTPTELDALVFGHVFTIITTRLPCRKLAETVKRHESLVSLAKRVDEHYFKRP